MMIDSIFEIYYLTNAKTKCRGVFITHAIVNKYINYINRSISTQYKYIILLHSNVSNVRYTYILLQQKNQKSNTTH